MEKFRFKNGQTSNVLRFKLFDASITTDARGITGLGFSSSGLVISTIAANEATPTFYSSGASTIETVSVLGTFAAPTASKCRFAEVDAVKHPGLYELHLADARFAVASAKSLIVSLSGATNLTQAELMIELVSDDPYVAKPANFNLLSVDSNGRVDVIKLAGTTQTARDIGASVLLSSGTGTGQLSLSSGLVDITQTAADKVWGTAARSLTSVTNIVSGGAITTAAGAVSNVTTVATATNVTTVATTTNVTNGVTLTSSATSAQLVADVLASIDASSTKLASILGDTNELQTLWTGGGTLALLLNALAGYVDTEVAAIKAKTDQLTFTVTNKADVSIQAATDVTTAVANKIADHVLRRTLVNALASSNGDAKTFKTLAGAIAKLVDKVVVSGGTMTTYEPDGTTTLGTQTATTSVGADPITALG